MINRGRVLALLGVAAVAAAASVGTSQATHSVADQHSVEVPGAGKFQLCAELDGQTYGQCSNEKLIKGGVLTLRVERPGPHQTQFEHFVTAPLAYDSRTGCDPDQFGAKITGTRPSSSGRYYATLTGSNPITGEPVSQEVGPIDLGESGERTGGVRVCIAPLA